MSSTPAYHSPLQSYHVRNLILILRRANAHYAHVAATIRASFVPTHHARKRAHHIGLTVNIQKAVACDHLHVSLVPLPIIDHTPSPLPLLEDICRQVNELNTLVSLQGRRTLKCAIPPQRVAILTQTSPNGTTSGLSDEGMSFSTPAASMDVEDLALPDWLHLDVSTKLETIDWGLELDSDVENEEIRQAVDAWDIDGVSGGSPASSASGSACNSNSSVSSAGPITPPVAQDAQYIRPLAIHMKRKSEGTCEKVNFIKRPRFARAGSDEWTCQAVRQQQRRIPPRK